ncbi:taste receptor type 1 member 1-like [Cololabis saira]|uniref:taste receptor type 1 member 1-like n=1 Tax=Cololabis saira TaxID=129043 RepID=UPI002AD1DE4C|nr:taste receptor type 1 member 1-like [Cololabis saira]
MEMIAEAQLPSVYYRRGTSKLYSSSRKSSKRNRRIMARLLHLCFLGYLLHALTECTISTSEFRLDGDYLIGGLFDVHHVNDSYPHNRPEAITCSSQPLILSSYQRFQLMRFAIEEINNSTSLLPNVSLGYEIFDHCSDMQNIPNILNLMSDDGRVQPWSDSYKNLSKLIAVVGTYTSTETRTVAPFFMMDRVPMISYGAASSIFSRKKDFPSFLRTLHPNQDVIKMVVKILQHFGWRWVSFLYINDDYGSDGHNLFLKEIKDTDICLAYSKGLDDNTDYHKVLKRIDLFGVNVIIVFAAEWTAERLIRSAIQHNINNKVWIAGDGWSLHKKLPKEKGIEKIGTVLGVAERIVPVPGFRDFLKSSKTKIWYGDVGQTSCNQNCSCSSVTAEDVIAADPSFSFPVYAAVYAIAHALHNVLQCGAGRCNRSITAHPQMVFKELQSSNFTLLNKTINFNETGDPMFGSYSVVFWNHSGIEVAGSCHFQPFNLSINDTKIKWRPNGTMPTSFCTPECEEGHKKKQEGAHKCCFNCTICQGETYINITGGMEMIAEAQLPSVYYRRGTSKLYSSSRKSSKRNRRIMARLLHLCFLGYLLHALTECAISSSEFRLDGDYLIGGLFDVHHVNDSYPHNRPEAITCSR